MTASQPRSAKGAQKTSIQDQSKDGLQPKAQQQAQAKLDPSQKQSAQQLELTPKDKRFIEVSDPWATHNKQAGTAREKLGQIKQAQGQQQTQPAPGSARAKLAQMQQQQGPAKQQSVQQKQQQQQGIER